MLQCLVRCLILLGAAAFACLLVALLAAVAVDSLLLTLPGVMQRT